MRKSNDLEHFLCDQERWDGKWRGLPQRGICDSPNFAVDMTFRDGGGPGRPKAGYGAPEVYAPSGRVI